MTQGESIFKVVDGVECIVWKAKRIVYISNNITPPSQASTVLRRNKDSSQSSVPCPESIRLCNTYMGELDVFDSRKNTYSSSRNSRDWWLFYSLLDTTVTNAYILYKDSVQNERSPWRCLSWGSVNIFYPVPTVANYPASKICIQKLDCVSTTSWIAWTSFKVCTERPQTKICCKTCCPERHVVLCPVDCFRIYQYTTQNSA